MSTSKKEAKKLKGPDAYQLKMAELTDKLTKNWGLIAGVVGGILAIYIGFLGFNAYTDDKLETRRIGLAKVMEKYTDEMKAAVEQRQDIEKEIATLKAPPPTGKKGDEDKADKKTAPNNDAKIKELEAKIEKIKPDHSGSMKGFKEFFEQNKDQPEGYVAAIRYSSLALKKGEDPKNLSQMLEGVFNSSKGLLVLQVQSGFMLAGIHNDIGEYDKAISVLSELEKVVPDDLKAKVLLEKGRSLHYKKDKTKAAEVFETVIRDHSSSAEADKARSLKALVN